MTAYSLRAVAVIGALLSLLQYFGFLLPQAEAEWYIVFLDDIKVWNRFWR